MEKGVTVIRRNGSSAPLDNLLPGVELGAAADELTGPAPVEIGSRVAGILAAAERASDELRAEARSEAQSIRNEAQRKHDEAAAVLAEAEAEAERTRAEAADYANDVRLAVEMYAAECRSEVDEEVERTRTEANVEAAAIRAEALAEVDRMEKGSREIVQQMQREVEALEGRRELVLDQLRDIAAQISSLG